MTRYTCPVCGYDQLEDPPTNFNICPSCGTEFEYHDAGFTHAQLRQRWIKAGALWWDLDMAPSVDWSAEAQLHNIGYVLTGADRAAIAQARASALGPLELRPRG